MTYWLTIRWFNEERGEEGSRLRHNTFSGHGAARHSAAPSVRCTPNSASPYSQYQWSNCWERTLLRYSTYTNKFSSKSNSNRTEFHINRARLCSIPGLMISRNVTWPTFSFKLTSSPSYVVMFRQEDGDDGMRGFSLRKLGSLSSPHLALV